MKFTLVLIRSCVWRSPWKIWTCQSWCPSLNRGLSSRLRGPLPKKRREGYRCRARRNLTSHRGDFRGNPFTSPEGGVSLRSMNLANLVDADCCNWLDAEQFFCGHNECGTRCSTICFIGWGASQSFRWCCSSRQLGLRKNSPPHEKSLRSDFVSCHLWFPVHHLFCLAVWVFMVSYFLMWFGNATVFMWSFVLAIDTRFRRSGLESGLPHLFKTVCNVGSTGLAQCVYM